MIGEEIEKHNLKLFYENDSGDDETKNYICTVCGEEITLGGSMSIAGRHLTCTNCLKTRMDGEVSLKSMPMRKKRLERNTVKNMIFEIGVMAAATAVYLFVIWS